MRLLARIVQLMQIVSVSNTSIKHADQTNVYFVACNYPMAWDHYFFISAFKAGLQMYLSSWCSEGRFPYGMTED